MLIIQGCIKPEEGTDKEKLRCSALVQNGTQSLMDVSVRLSHGLVVSSHYALTFIAGN